MVQKSKGYKTLRLCVMNWHQIPLHNGLRIITIPRLGTRTVAARLFIRAGSRYDGAYPGLAHFTEHLLFKGKEQIFADIEARGGELNAQTGREYLGLHTVTLGSDLPLALTLLSELILQPEFSSANFLAEKLVIAGELEQARDRSSVLYDHFQQQLWGAEHPFGRPVLGAPQGLDALELAYVEAFYRQRFVGGNAVLVICGDIDVTQALSLAVEAFAELPAGSEQHPEPLPETPRGSRGAHIERASGRSYLLVGVPTVGLKHPDRSALKIIELVLGMGASGRLYRRIREEMGLVYTVNAVSGVYEDAGYLAVHSVCAPEQVVTVQDAVFDLWAEIAELGITPAELAAAQGNYAGTLARRFETNLSVAGIFGIEALLHEVEPFEAAIARINGVITEQVCCTARRYLQEDEAVIVSMGHN